MLVQGQTVTIKLNRMNRDRYIKLGYPVTDSLTELEIKAEHLPSHNRTVLDFACDECGEIHQKQWKSHFDYLTKKEKEDICPKCFKNQRNSFYIEKNKEDRVYGSTKYECLKKVMRKEASGYEVCFPIQKAERLNENTNTMETYYYTVMKLAN